jgi:hypothetical protein
MEKDHFSSKNELSDLVMGLLFSLGIGRPPMGGMYGLMSKLTNKPLTESLGPFYRDVS